MLLPDLPKVSHVDRTAIHRIQQTIDQSKKPVGALGQIENMAQQVALIQDTSKPTLEPLASTYLTL